MATRVLWTAQLVIVLVLASIGVIVCALAGFLASEVKKYGDPRYATYWVGIASVVLIIPFLSIHCMIGRKQPYAKVAFIIWLILMAVGLLCSLIGMGILASQAQPIAQTEKGDCAYIDQSGDYHSTVQGQQVSPCQSQCQRGLKSEEGIANPQRTCCCCERPSSVQLTGYRIVYAQSVSDCDVMFGVVFDCLVALSVLHALLACLYTTLVALGLISLLGICGVESLFPRDSDQGVRE